MGGLARLAVTLGEPAGIGPELMLRLACSDLDADLVAIGDRRLLVDTARRLDLAVRVDGSDAAGARLQRRTPGSLRCIDMPLPAPVTPGRLDAANAPAVVATLQRGADGCTRAEFDALLTLPVHKGVINDAGIAFSGHTEYFAAHAGVPVLMLLAAPDRDSRGDGWLKVALATTHLPLARVPGHVDAARLATLLRLLDAGLRRDFALAAPRIAVLGLNPHAGEGGHLGLEEIEVIAPVLAALRGEGLALSGPLPADTAFVPRLRREHDAYVAMFHDQGLPVLKAIGFGAAVNVTLGLPWVRTSVDHGVALDLAGSGSADAGSAFAAARLALAIARRRLA